MRGKPGFVRTVPLAAVVCLSACGGGAATDPGPASNGSPSVAATGATPTAPSGDRWLAAIEVAPRADDLDGLTERVRDALGPALVVSPVDCYEGLPPAVDDGYVIGAVGASQQQAERIVTEAGEAVMFSASVMILCTD